MRVLDSKKLPYNYLSYEMESTKCEDVAAALGQDVERVFKTLVTVGRSGEHYVFMVPGGHELDLKKAAKAAGEKNLEMIPQKQLLPLTGYIHGGCSPIGMKKPFPTFIDETAVLWDTIFFSAGKIGHQIEMALDDLCQVIEVTPVDIVKD